MTWVGLVLLPFFFPERLVSTLHITCSELPNFTHSTPSPTDTNTGFVIFSLWLLCLLRSNSSQSLFFLLSRACRSCFLPASTPCRCVYCSSSYSLNCSTRSLKPFSSFFSKESPTFRNSPAATITLIASYTRRLMLRESFDSLEKLSISTRLMCEYFSRRLRSKSLARRPAMNFSPFTSSPSVSRYSSTPPRARPRNSVTAAGRSSMGGGMRQWSSILYKYY